MLKSRYTIPFGFPKVVSCLCHRAVRGVSTISAGDSGVFAGGGLISKLVAMNGFSAGRCKSFRVSAICLANVSRSAVFALLYFV